MAFRVKAITSDDPPRQLTMADVGEGELWACGDLAACVRVHGKIIVFDRDPRAPETQRLYVSQSLPKTWYPTRKLADHLEFDWD